MSEGKDVTENICELKPSKIIDDENPKAIDELDDKFYKDLSSHFDDTEQSFPSIHAYLGYSKDYFRDCRACLLKKTDEQIMERWSNKELPGQDWDVDDDDDFVHTHEIVKVVNGKDSNSHRSILMGNGSTFGPLSKKLFTDAIKNNPITHVSVNHSCIERLDSSIWVSMEKIEHLLAAGCRLEAVPNQLKLLKHLRTLDLSYNHLKSIPDWFGNFSHLLSLNLDGNRLTSLPDKICDLSNLECLSVSTNEIETLPDGFGNLAKLKSIDIAFNKLSQIPDSFGSLKFIENIDLKRNRIEKLPVSFAGLSNLVTLDLSDNDINELPRSIGFASTVKHIYLDNNYLFRLPEWFDDLPNLVKLSCENNKLQGALSDSFLSTCKKLTELNFSGNLLDRIPETIAALQTLTYLEFGSPLLEPERRPDLKNGNRLKYLPELFGVSSSNLVELKLDENDIVTLPRNFGTGLINLRKINLYHNELTELPSSFCCMEKLESCILSYNNLKNLPKNIGDLVNLTVLKLDSNQLYEIPFSFMKFTNLETLDLYGNKFDALPSVLRKLPKIDCMDLGIEVVETVLSLADPATKMSFMPLYKTIYKNHSKSAYYFSKDTLNYLTDLIENFERKEPKLKPLSSPGQFKRMVGTIKWTAFENNDDEDSQLYDWNGNYSSFLLNRHSTRLRYVPDAREEQAKILRDIVLTKRSHEPRLPKKSTYNTPRQP